MPTKCLLEVAPCFKVWPLLPGAHLLVETVKERMDCLIIGRALLQSRQPYLPTTLSRTCSTLGPFAYILHSTWSFFPELWIHFFKWFVCVCMCLCLHVQSQKALDPLELVTGDVSHPWWTLGTEFWFSGIATLSTAEPSLQFSRLVFNSRSLTQTEMISGSR